MKKIAAIFPGQGSQYNGMGKSLYKKFSKAKYIFDSADLILGFPLSKICFNGSEDELKQTNITQVAIFTHSIAASVCCDEKSQMCAGHSVGEYSALVFANVLNFEDGLKLVQTRANAMHEAGTKKNGTMAAIIGLEKDKLEEICHSVSNNNEIVVCANFNSTSQIVISGNVEAVKKAMIIAKENGAKLVKELSVSGAFHSPLMKSAKEKLQNAIEKIKFCDAQIPVYCNVSASPETSGEKIKSLLIEQLTSPVLWNMTIEKMISDGCKKFFEIGPGKILQGLVKKINTNIEIGGFE